ncbi:MAG: hypothetical protein MUC77_02320 [Chromatiaceae bacterium]|nr:hypothetical protein [Chromatiaceae bacterium]
MSPVSHFTLAVFLWLPVCFALWFYASILFVAPIAASVELLLQTLLPGVIDEVHQRGNGLLVVTHVSVQQAVGVNSRTGELVLELNPLKYGYGVPVFSALVLASPASEARRLGSWIIGVAVLFGIQAVGVATEAVKVLAFDTGPEARSALAFTRLGDDVLALVYQFAFLILPSISPIVLWIWQFRRELPQITGIDGGFGSARPRQ